MTVLSKTDNKATVELTKEEIEILHRATRAAGNTAAMMVHELKDHPFSASLLLQESNEYFALHAELLPILESWWDKNNDTSGEN